MSTRCDAYLQHKDSSLLVSGGREQGRFQHFCITQKEAVCKGQVSQMLLVEFILHNVNSSFFANVPSGLST
jgi:hypothetical protein